METMNGTRPGTGGVTLTEAAQLLGINRDALKKRVQRGAIPAYKDETGAWFVVIPEGDTTGEVSRDMEEGQVPGHVSPAASQLAGIMDQWLAPLVRQIAEQGEEIGGLKADLRNERERRAAVEQDYDVAKKELAALRMLARATENKRHEAPERPGEDQSRATSGTTSHSPPRREPAASPPRSWWRRLFGLELGMPSGYPTRDTPSIYQPLLDVLAASQEEEVVLTFKEIAAVIGRALPESAILRTGWWTSKGHHHVALWLAIGWHARVDRDHLRVLFTRDVREDTA